MERPFGDDVTTHSTSLLLHCSSSRVWWFLWAWSAYTYTPSSLFLCTTSRLPPFLCGLSMRCERPSPSWHPFLWIARDGGSGLSPLLGRAMHPRHQATRKQQGGKKGEAWSRKRADEDRGGITRKMSVNPGGASSERSSSAAAQQKQSIRGSSTTKAPSKERGAARSLAFLT